MRNTEKIARAQRAKMQARAPAAGGPDEGGKIEVLTKEIKENRKAMEVSAAKKSATEAAKKQEEKAAIEAQAAKEDEAQAVESELEVFTTKPITATHMDCPFCGSEKSIKGMGRHIATIHEVPGITIQDLDDVEEGLKSLPDLVSEKFEGEATIVNLSPEVEKGEFSNWFDVEEDPEDPEENPEEEKPKDPEDPGKEAKGNGAAGVLPFVLLLGIPAALVLSRIPKFKEIGDRLMAALGDLGSKGSQGSKDPRDSQSSFNQSGFYRRF